MSESEWTIDFDVAAFMEANYPGFLRPEDDHVWEQWARFVGFRHGELGDLIKDHEVRLSLKARAALARRLPSQLLPFCWEERENGPWYDTLADAYEPARIPKILLQLQFNSICSLMEALPKSTLFDQSSHPLVFELPRLNGQLRDYLAARSGESSIPDWLNRDRALDCYRLQSAESEKFLAVEGQFAAFFKLLKSKSIGESWKSQADIRVQEMTRRELDGDPECTGSLQGYTQVVLAWINSTDEAPPPYPFPLLQSQVEFLVGLDHPQQRPFHFRCGIMPIMISCNR